MSKTKVEELHRVVVRVGDLSTHAQGKLDALLEAVREETRAKGWHVSATERAAITEPRKLKPLGIDPQSAREWALCHALLKRLGLDWNDDAVHLAFEDIAEEHPFRSLQPYVDLVVAAQKVSSATAYIDATNMVVSNANEVISVLRFALERLEARG